MGAPGYDDAPIVRLELGQPKHVTFVYPYYENPQFLEYQLSMWRLYPETLVPYISAVIVDDGSPDNPAARVLRGARHPFPIRLFRIEVDVRWNWLAARNIAMYHAPSGWCLLTDMDHVITPSMASSLVRERHSLHVIYRPSRVESSGKEIHPHPNSMFMTKETFWRVGGYDESLSGYYGTDGDWRRRCASTAKVLTLEHPLVRHEYEKDSSTTRYLRKQPEDANKKRILSLRKGTWKPKVLSFPYHEVML